MPFGDRLDSLLAYRRGERSALEQIYRGHVRVVERYLLALARESGADELAQANVIADLIQEVFVRAFSARGREGYDGVRAIGGYLLGIARNCFFDLRRAGRREVLKDPAEVQVALEALEARPATWSEPLVSTVLATFLAGLPAATRAVCEQRFVLGRSQDEVADATGLSRKQLRTAEKHLRVGLRKALAHAGISLSEVRMIVADAPDASVAAAAPRRVEPSAP
jgi:RNA polymerase sigma-70 factor, ECF subfamily